MRFLFVDRILDLQPGVSIRGVKHITPTDPFLYNDPHGQPYFTPTLIGEALGQLAAWNVMSTQDFRFRPVAGVAEEAIAKRPVRVGETLLLESFIDQLDETAVNYHSIARVNDEPVFTLHGALGPLLPMTDFIDTDTVRLQFQHLYRPTNISSTWTSSLPTEKVGSINHPTATSEFYFDHLLTHEPGQSITAEKKICFHAPYFADHFPRRPVFPLTILLECIANLAQPFLPPGPRAIAFKKIKTKAFIQPGDTIQTTLTVRSAQHEPVLIHSQTFLDGKRIAVAELHDKGPIT